jgi:hypothetical protein
VVAAESSPLDDQGTSRFVVPHISRKTSEMPGFPVPCAIRGRVCGFLHGKPHEVRWVSPSPTGNPGIWGIRGLIVWTELEKNLAIEVHALVRG